MIPALPVPAAVAALVLLLASVAGLAAFVWPLLISPGASVAGHSADAPLVFLFTLPVLVLIVLAELGAGGIDAKALALLGVLAAINAALRPLGAGTAGIETVFFLLVLAGRVFGPGFGFVLGATSLFASALLTAGVGPVAAVPDAGRVLGRPRRRAASAAGAGQAEIALLAGYGVVAAYAYGLLLNMWFWPFATGPGTDLSYVAGAPVLENLQRFLVFTVVTSTVGWDTGRASPTSSPSCCSGRRCSSRCAGPPGGPPSTLRSSSTRRARLPGMGEFDTAYRDMSWKWPSVEVADLPGPYGTPGCCPPARRPGRRSCCCPAVARRPPPGSRTRRRCPSAARVHAVDLPGTAGGTAVSVRDAAGLCGWLDSVLDAISDGPVDLAGHSGSRSERWAGPAAPGDEEGGQADRSDQGDRERERADGLRRGAGRLGGHRAWRAGVRGGRCGVRAGRRRGGAVRRGRTGRRGRCRGGPARARAGRTGMRRSAPSRAGRCPWPTSRGAPGAPAPGAERARRGRWLGGRLRRGLGRRPRRRPRWRRRRRSRADARHRTPSPRSCPARGRNSPRRPCCSSTGRRGRRASTTSTPCWARRCRGSVSRRSGRPARETAARTCSRARRRPAPTARCPGCRPRSRSARRRRGNRSRRPR